MLSKNNTLKKCVDAFKVARMTIIDAIEKLYEVHKSNAWEGSYDSWSEFCEDGLHISRSLGSQYVAVWEHYAVEGSLAAKQLREVDATKLYLLIPSKGTPEEKLAMAATLSRQELRDNRNDVEPHKHLPISICSKCHMRLP